VLQGEEEDTVYVWERYASESALREVHHVSEGYLRMRERMGGMVLGRDISGYYEVFGFLSKEGGLVGGA
jgi:quinol monooxygenase YgiN